MMICASGRMHWFIMRKSGKSEELPGFFDGRKKIRLKRKSGKKGEQGLINK